MNQPPRNTLKGDTPSGILADLDRRRASQRRAFYARRPKQIGNVVAQLVQRRGYAQIHAAAEWEQAWQDALKRRGDDLTQIASRAVKFRRGVLEVQVANSLMMQELTFHKEGLLKELKTAIDGVQQIKFTLGQVP